MNDEGFPQWVVEAGERQAANDATEQTPLALCQKALARHRQAMAAMSGINASWRIYKELSDRDVAAAMEMLARLACSSDDSEQLLILSELKRMAGYVADQNGDAYP